MRVCCEKKKKRIFKFLKFTIYFETIGWQWNYWNLWCFFTQFNDENDATTCLNQSIWLRRIRILKQIKKNWQISIQKWKKRRLFDQRISSLRGNTARVASHKHVDIALITPCYYNWEIEKLEMFRFVWSFERLTSGGPGVFHVPHWLFSARRIFLLTVTDSKHLFKKKNFKNFKIIRNNGLLRDQDFPVCCRTPGQYRHLWRRNGSSAKKHRWQWQH